jgi:hypothetical protein
MLLAPIAMSLHACNLPLNSYGWKRAERELSCCDCYRVAAI